MKIQSLCMLMESQVHFKSSTAKQQCSTLKKMRLLYPVKKKKRKRRSRRKKITECVKKPICMLIISTIIFNVTKCPNKKVHPHQDEPENSLHSGGGRLGSNMAS